MRDPNPPLVPAAGARPWRRWRDGWRAGLLVLVCVVTGAAFAFGWWRAGGAGLLTLALAMLPCGIACALGLCVLERGKASKARCHGKAPSHPGH